MKKILYYFGVICLATFLFVEPYTRSGLATSQVHLLTLTLSIWIALSAVVIIPNILRGSKDISFLVGLITLAILVIRSLLSLDPKSELLPISYSIIFMCSSIIARDVSIRYEEYNRILYGLFITSLVAAVYANLLSLGVLGDKSLVLGETRFSFVYDANSMLIAAVISISTYLYRPTMLKGICLISALSLILLRLLSFGSKGPVIMVLGIVAVVLAKLAPKKNKLTSVALIVGFLSAVAIAISQLPLVSDYLNIFTSRFQSSDTFMARLNEAGNDFQAFLDKPILGWGREVPGINLLDESSSGHITLTGMLSRLGLIGTVGLGFFYFKYFVKKQQYMRCQPFHAAQAMYLGLSIFVMYLLVMGNPLFLFPAWAFLPLLLPTLDSRRGQ